MNKKKLIVNGLYLVVALIAFWLSLFKTDNQVWIAAWIAPIFLIRFMRSSKWVWAVILGYLMLGISFTIGWLPVFASMNMDGMENFDFMLMWEDTLISILTLPIFLIPFILDKAFYKRLPKVVSHLLFPTALVACELGSSFVRGTLISFGQSQIDLNPLVMTSSVFGIFGLTFLIGWFASIINLLWKEEWDIKKLGLSGLIYISVMAVMLIYGAITVVFPKKADKVVPVAGIILDCNFEERVFASSGPIVTPKSNPVEYTEQISSPEFHLHEIREKTLKAIKAGGQIYYLAGICTYIRIISG